MRVAAVWIVLASSLATAQPAAQPTAATVLANVQHYYMNANQLTADFVQAVTNTVFGATTTSEGKLWVDKPSKLRADYHQHGTNKLTKSFIFDGQILWYVDHVNKVITRSAAQTSTLPAAVSFLTGASTLASQFNVTRGATTANEVVLELTPKQPSAQYKQLVFHVDTTDWHVAESIVVDTNGNTNDFTFVAPNVTASVKTSWFQVNPASLPTYRVVTMPASGPASGAAPPSSGAPAPATP